MLLGRTRERADIDRLLRQVRDGQGGVLILRGDPGIGKSTLLRYASSQMEGFQVTRATGVQAELLMPYAGLQQLCAGLPTCHDRLPAPQAGAIRHLMGVDAGGLADPYLLGLALKGMVSTCAQSAPVAFVIDDAHWLDADTVAVLGFVARRLEDVPVLFLIASRPGRSGDPWEGLPQMTLPGLTRTESRQLLTTSLPGQLDDDVVDRIIEEADGNPLALLELPRALSPGEIAGGFGLPARSPLPGRIRQAFLRQVRGLPQPTRTLLLLAAAEPTGDPGLLWRSAEHLGVPTAAIAPAEALGLISVGHRVTFRHPLTRSAVYGDATPQDRRQAHAALACAVDAKRDPDRRAWHLAAGALGPDAEAAAALERSAERAQARGGFVAAAAFLERAVDLSDTGPERARRALAAARLKELAGLPDDVPRLLDLVEALSESREDHADALRLRGRAAFAQKRGSEATRYLLRAARLLDALPARPQTASVTPTAAGSLGAHASPSVSTRSHAVCECYLEALSAAVFSAGGRGDPDLLEVAYAARAASGTTPPDGARAPASLLLNGLADLVLGDSRSATVALRHAVAAFDDSGLSTVTQLRWGWLACRASVLVWDDRAWTRLTDRASTLAREVGALTALHASLSSQMARQVLFGDPEAALGGVDESETLGLCTGVDPLPYGPTVVRSWTIRGEDLEELLERTLLAATASGEGMAVALVRWARALRHNSLGQYQEAVVEAEAAVGYPAATLYAHWALPELVEAAARAGDAARAGEALERLVASTTASGTEWARGVEARSRALLADDGSAESLHREAVERLSRTSVRADLARAHLLYGEWLRRERRRGEAREQLSAAEEWFSLIGAEAFAERARGELAATGARTRARRESGPPELTPQECRVAELACAGLSNKEIAAQLFVSVHTVDYHLRKVFRKLGITSRARLHVALPGAVSARGVRGGRLSR